MDKIKVGVLGATGLVGQVFMKILSDHPWFEVTAVSASGNKTGRTYGESVNWILGGEPPENIRDLTILPPDPQFFPRDIEIVFSALPADVSKEIEPLFVGKGYTVVSNARSYRLDSDVPLLVPEVNHKHIQVLSRQKETRGWKGYLLKNPNCSTAILVLALKPLIDNFTVERVIVTTQQALSGAGYRGGVLSMDILDNIIPYIKNEEWKLENEPLKILGRIENDEFIPPPVKIVATTTRVPVLHGHLETVIFETTESVRDEEEVIRAIEEYKWPEEITELPTAPEKPVVVKTGEDRPQPRLDRNAGNGMSVVVGRVRRYDPHTIRFLVLGHNLVRGAAGNAVLIGEYFVRWLNLL